MIGTIFDIKEFSVHDGPGPRVTVFLKGCPLRCRWCHNPEGLEMRPQLMIKHNLCTHCGRCKKPCRHEACKEFERCLYACPNGLISVSGEHVEAKTLAERLMKDADFYNSNGGGVTFSGGEPLYQPEFLCELMRAVKMHKAIQTSGFVSPKVFQKVLELCDYVMLDIKLADRELHKQYTGVYNDCILENYAILKASGKPYIIRTPMIPDVTDTEENLKRIQDIIQESPWEKIPYNQMAGAKYAMLGLDYKNS